MRRLLSILLCNFLILSIVAGCGQSGDFDIINEQGGKITPNYVTLDQACENTIGEKYLEIAESRPAFEELPATHAMILKPLTFEELFGQSLIPQDFIEMVADTKAFNAVHIGYECEFYYSTEENKIDLNYLENLDRVIEWCIENELHIVWDFATVPGYGGGGVGGDILENPEHYRQAIEMLEMFGTRYADVPGGVMSYYILGEADSTYFSEENFVKLTEDLTNALRICNEDIPVRSNIWTDDFAGEYMSGQCNGLANTDTMVGFELYTGQVSTLMRFPNNVVANGKLYANGDKMKILGDFPAGTEVTCLITVADGVGLDLEFSICADGQELEIFDCNTLNEDSAYFIRRDGEYYVDVAGYPLTVTLPADTKELTLQSICEEDSSTMVVLDNVMIKIPSDKPYTYPVFYRNEGDWVTRWRYETDNYQVINIMCSSAWKGEILPLTAVTVTADGSLQMENNNPYVQTPESIQNYVEQWAKWSKDYDAPVWVSEWGYPMSMPTDERVAYVRCALEELARYDIGWTMYTDFQANWGPIIHKQAFEDHVSEPPNSGYVKHGDFYWDEPILEVLREYLPTDNS